MALSRWPSSSYFPPKSSLPSSQSLHDTLFPTHVQSFNLLDSHLPYLLVRCWLRGQTLHHSYPTVHNPLIHISRLLSRHPPDPALGDILQFPFNSQVRYLDKTLRVTVREAPTRTACRRSHHGITCDSQCGAPARPLTTSTLESHRITPKETFPYVPPLLLPLQQIRRSSGSVGTAFLSLGGPMLTSAPVRIPSREKKKRVAISLHQKK